MEYSSKERSRELGSLLNAVERGNKRDAIDYTGGHLNEANLYKAPELYGHPGWKSGKKPGISLQKPSRLPAPKRRDEDGEMANVLTQFSLGNDGFLPSVKKKKAPQKSGSRRASREDWPQELTGSVDERALIEELDSRRFMLNRSQPPRPSKSWASEDEIDRKVRSSLDEHKGRPNRGFYSLNAGATKRDQFRDFKKFESNTLRKQDALERKVLSGEGAILQIEQKLMKVGTVYSCFLLRVSLHQIAFHRNFLMVLMIRSVIGSTVILHRTVKWTLFTGPMSLINAFFAS